MRTVKTETIAYQFKELDFNTQRRIRTLYKYKVLPDIWLNGIKKQIEQLDFELFALKGYRTSTERITLDKCSHSNFIELDEQFEYDFSSDCEDIIETILNNKTYPELYEKALQCKKDLAFYDGILEKLTIDERGVIEDRVFAEWNEAGNQFKRYCARFFARTISKLYKELTQPIHVENWALKHEFTKTGALIIED